MGYTHNIDDEYNIIKPMTFNTRLSNPSAMFEHTTKNSKYIPHNFIIKIEMNLYNLIISITNFSNLVGG